MQTKGGGGARPQAAVLLSRRRRLAGQLAGDAKTKLRCTNQQDEGTKIKRRGRGFHRAARRGGRGAGGADRRRGAAGGLLLRRASLGRRCRGEEELE
jgi:hypothetical protein